MIDIFSFYLKEERHFNPFWNERFSKKSFEYFLPPEIKTEMKYV